MNFGERLRILREKFGYTQSDIAKALKTTQSYYAQYENNRRQITLERAAELARFYGVSLDYIAGLNDNINRHW